MKRLLFLLLFCSNYTAFAQQKVLTGIHLMNLYNIDINQHTFYADFYVWFKWQGEKDPTKIEFVNAVEKWGFTQRPVYEEHLLLPDGYLYNVIRIEGRFYHAFDLVSFPLDEHHLHINMEHIQYTADSLIFLPDSNSASIRGGFALPGWDIRTIEGKAENNQYVTNFGETGRLRPRYSDFAFNLHIARPLNYFLLKLFLPLFIVVLISLGALLVQPLNIDARVSLSIGGLLAAVFLQQSYSDALPDVGYMVFMDKIYLIVYALITATMLRVVLVGNHIAHHHETANLPMIRRRDVRMFFWLLATLFAGVLMLL